MSERFEGTEEKTGYIAKMLTSKSNEDWRGFVFQGDNDQMFSITLNTRVPPDLEQSILAIQKQSHLTFYYIPNEGKDGKIYNNIHGMEFVKDVDEDMRDKGKDREKDEGEDKRKNDSEQKPKYTNGADLRMERCNATNNATLIFNTMVTVQGGMEGLKFEDWETWADFIYVWHKAKRYE